MSSHLFVLSFTLYVFPCLYMDCMNLFIALFSVDMHIVSSAYVTSLNSAPGVRLFSVDGLILCVRRGIGLSSLLGQRVGATIRATHWWHAYLGPNARIGCPNALPEFGRSELAARIWVQNLVAE